jgi:hypothetical protein
MKLKVLHSFEAYPGGQYRSFYAGEIVNDLDDDYAQLLITKGHVEPVDSPGPRLPLTGGGKK